MTKAIIVEDEKRSADALNHLVKRYCQGVEVVSQAESVKIAIETITLAKPDLVFLDVGLPDGSGFKILEAFPKDHFNFIFVTAYEHYAIKAIKACALDYLLKPVDIDELMAAVNKVKTEQYKPELQDRKEALFYNSRQTDMSRRKVALPTNEGLRFVFQEDIVYCEAENNYTNFILKTGQKIMVCKSLNHFEGILDAEYFCRSHSSFLVNLTYAEKYVKGRGGYLVMSNGAKVEVSERMKPHLLGKFSK